MAEEYVHDANTHGGRAAWRSWPGAARLGHVDPEARGFHEAVEGRVARVLAGHAQRLHDRILCVREQRRHPEKAENSRAPTPEEQGAAFDQIVIDPWRILFEFFEQSHH